MPASKGNDSTALYQRLLDAFRSEPANIHKAAQTAGCTWKTANRMWVTGSKRFQLPAISTIIREEQEKARAMIEAERLAKAAERRREIEASSEQAVQARKQEGQMTTMVRSQTLAALTSVSVFAKEARGLAEAIQGQVSVERQKLKEWTAYEAELVAGNTAAVPPVWLDTNANVKHQVRSLDSLLAILQRTATYSRDITACARQAMELERLHLGEPLAVIRHEMEVREMTMDEVEIRKESAIRALDRAAERGGLKLLHGGKDTPVVGQRVIVR
jgi:hypothetical protein